jgi:uncharacterized damage-inducible protein DinB
MTELDRILDQYDRAMHGHAWHGDSLWKILNGISPQQAATHVDPNAHNIWELVAHVTFWETQVYRRLNCLPDRSANKRNFPATPEATTENWNRTLEDLRRSNRDFRSAFAQLDDSQLDQPLPARKKSAYVELHGVIQHNLYHAGQIALLRRIVAAK